MVAEIADDVLVMYGGRAVEHGTVKDILASPLHPYTWGLLESIPAVSGDADPAAPDPGHPAEPAQPADRLCVQPALRVPQTGPQRPVPTELPDLAPRTDDPARLSRCHLAHPDEIFLCDILPRLP